MVTGANNHWCWLCEKDVAIKPDTGMCELCERKAIARISDKMKDEEFRADMKERQRANDKRIEDGARVYKVGNLRRTILKRHDEETISFFYKRPGGGTHMCVGYFGIDRQDEKFNPKGDLLIVVEPITG